MKNFTDTWIFKFLVWFLLSATIFCIFLFLVFIDLNKMASYMDTCFVVGAIFVALGSFQIIGNQGTFDLLMYSLSNLYFNVSNQIDKRYSDPYDYTNRRKEKRKRRSFEFIWPMAVGLLYFAAAIILFIIIQNVAPYTPSV